MSRTATFTCDVPRARPAGAIGLPRGEGVAFAFSPFPSYEDNVFAFARSGQGRAVCARSSKTLDGEDGRTRCLARERGFVSLLEKLGADRMDGHYEE